MHKVSFFITGKVKILILFLSFFTISLFAIYEILSKGEQTEFDWLVPITLLPLSILLLMSYLDAVKNNIQIGRNDLPSNYKLLTVGYMFSISGILLVYLQMKIHFIPETEIISLITYYLSSLIFLIPGLYMIYSFIRLRLDKKKSKFDLKIEEMELSNLIGLVVGILTLVSMFIMGLIISLFSPEKAIIGYIFMGVSLIIGGFIGVIAYFTSRK